MKKKLFDSNERRKLMSKTTITSSFFIILNPKSWACSWPLIACLERNCPAPLLAEWKPLNPVGEILAPPLTCVLGLNSFLREKPRPLFQTRWWDMVPQAWVHADATVNKRCRQEPVYSTRLPTRTSVIFETREFKNLSFQKSIIILSKLLSANSVGST